jgi:hypothetical protein
MERLWKYYAAGQSERMFKIAHPRKLKKRNCATAWDGIMSPFGPKAKRFGKLHMSAARGRPEIGDVAFDSRR